MVTINNSKVFGYGRASRAASGVSAMALVLGASLWAVPAAAQAGQASSNVPDPATSSTSAANPNEAASAPEQRDANAAVTGDQAAQGAPAADAQESGGDEVVVTGFRAALQSAVAEKKSREQVVESVSAEDIGKLPDASIAESIARLPGVTSQRVSGRSNQISIRGFSPDFSTTLLNGREQTSTGDNRAVEYDQYPSEVVNQVVVYKTADASLVGQGLSGTVDLRTIRPLEYGRKVVAIGARGTYADIGKLNAGSNDKGYRVSGTYVDQFFNKTLGVALSAAYLKEPYQIQQYNAWGFDTGNAAAPGTPVIGGSKSYVTSTELKRLGVQGTVEWRPVDAITVTVDGFYSDFSDEQISRGIELPLSFAGTVTTSGVSVPKSPLTNPVIENGLVTSGTFNNVEGVVRNDAFDRKAKLYSFGYNTKYEGEDGWNAQLDISLSRTERSEIVLETYSGTGYGPNVGATDTIGFQSGTTGTTFTHGLDYSDPNLIQLTDPLGWGGATRQAGYYNDRAVVDDIHQYRVEVEKEIQDFPLSSVRFGMNYTDHYKTLTPTQYYLVLQNGALSQALPDQYRLKPTNVAYLGLGPILSYDPRELLDGGVYSRVQNLSNDVISSAFRVDEDIMTTYLQGNIRQPIGTAELTGNFGVQAVFTEQKSSGLVYNGASFNRITRGDTYVDVLPSMNLSLRLASDWVFRVAAARQMQRPRMDDMRAANGYSYSTGEGIITGNGGNPYLRPIRSNSFDATIEKYFGNRGYLAVQGYYKDLKSFVYNLEVPYDFSGYPLPTGAPVGTPTLGRNTQPINGQGGSIYGVEVAGTLPLGQITPILDGFGLTGGGSYTKTEIVPTPGGAAEDIPGYSRWVANGTAFFEKWGLNLRGSVRYRSTFIGELSGFGAARVRRRAIDEMIVDGQIGYDFRDGLLKGLSVYIQGQNLTDEPFVTINGTARDQVIDYQSYGRRFLAGFNYKF
ncbi:TonB-dependent receptor [Sphingomonas aerophila]|uniref:Iron complex outermembrane receptor protein n=1 Tax=Sphingomonas aerophila TaxID=1344948 RepID=A0A7W9EW85_9SPHN|nr:iron complex outermembrane receptor protein [Sphingomonas aerophila]